jgi:hypothetical protein
MRWPWPSSDSDFSTLRNWTAEEQVKRAAVGFRVHSGWAALVALAVEKGAPAVLARERVHLVQTFTYEYRQPYHSALKLGPEEGRVFISRSKAEARRMAVRAIKILQASLETQGYKLIRSGVLLASGRTLPNLPQILASHALIHTADGELFREALVLASERCGLETMRVKEREVLDAASRALGIRSSVLTRRIAELGRPLGPPWSQDEKLASTVAWLALASRS